MTGSLDCVVVGGGVIGLAVARRLAREGLTASLFDRAECGREASWAGAGILVPCHPHRDDAIDHLHERSLAAYPRFCDDLRGESGIDPEYDASGALEILLSEEAVRIACAEERAAHGRTTADGRPILQLHSPEETLHLEPVVSRDQLGSLECRRTALVRNPRLLQALRASCLALGVRLVEHSAVADVIIERGRAIGVALARGETVPARFVVLCAGAWSSTIAPRLHALMPVRPIRGQIVLVRLEERRFTRVISQGKFYAAPRRDGHVLLGSTEEPDAGFAKRNTPQGVGDILTAATRVIPSLADAAIVACWSGLRPGTPDDKPYLGGVPGVEGLFAATGHFRVGLTLAPITAEVIVHAVLGRAHDLDLSCCAPGRSVPWNLSP